MTSKKYITLFLISILLCSLILQGRSQSSSQNQTEQHVPDSFEKDIPEFFQRQMWRNHFNNLQSLLGIRSLENGVKNWEIRFWISHGHMSEDSSQLLVLKQENNKIEGLLYTYIYDRGPDGEIISNFFKRLTSLSPLFNSWYSFLLRLESLGVYNLVDYKKIKGYELAMDSYGITIETATPKKYRIYYYPDYEGNIYWFDEARRIYIMMDMIETEFGIKVMY